MTRWIGSWKSSIGVLVAIGVAVTAYLATSQPKELDGMRATPEDSGSRPDLPAAVGEVGYQGSVEELTSRTMPAGDTRVPVEDQHAGGSEGAPSTDATIQAIRGFVEHETSLAGIIQLRKSFDIDSAKFQARFRTTLEDLPPDIQSQLRDVIRGSLDGLVDAALAHRLETWSAAEDRVLSGRFLTVAAGIPMDPRTYSSEGENSTVMFVPGASLGENRVLTMTRSEDPRVFQANDAVDRLVDQRDAAIRRILGEGK